MFDDVHYWGSGFGIGGHALQIIKHKGAFESHPTYHATWYPYGGSTRY